MNIIGIDPGRTGALVALDIDGRVITHKQQPLTKNGEDDLAAMAALLRSLSPIFAVAVEQVHVGPAISRHAGTVLCSNAGAWVGIAHGLGIERVWRPRPQEWLHTARMAARMGGSSKEVAVKAMRALFPDLFPGRFLKKQQGFADAALIAEWARQKVDAEWQASRSRST